MYHKLTENSLFKDKTFNCYYLGVEILSADSRFINQREKKEENQFLREDIQFKHIYDLSFVVHCCLSAFF